MQTIIGHLEQLSQKFVHYYGESLTSNSQNDWIIDPFAGKDLPQLPIHVAEQFMGMTTEAENHISSRPSKKNTPNIMQISTFGLPCTKCIPQFQNL